MSIMPCLTVFYILFARQAVISDVEHLGHAPPSIFRTVANRIGGVENVSIADITNVSSGFCRKKRRMKTAGAAFNCLGGVRRVGSRKA
jgi:hypothetical protein